MNGAESLVRTLVAGEVDVCFTNPGTSEMHFVSALDRVPGMRCVLGLFEGVVTGAADGYYRVAGRPASTLLHLGPGFGNGLANTHNAKRARSGIVHIVGDHATYHVQHDAPLTSDIEGIARPVSQWVKTSPDAKSIAADGARAIQAARRPPGQIATLILPANTAWGDADGPAAPLPVPVRPQVAADAVAACASVLRRGEPTFIVLGDVATRGKSLEWAGRIAAKTGCRIAVEFGVARFERGAGRVTPERIPYAVDAAVAMFKDTRQMILAGAAVPVSFFAYPGKASVQIPPECAVTRLAREDEDLEAALEALAEAVGARDTPPAHVAKLAPPAPATGAFSADGLASVIGAYMPEHAIVCDESVSTGRGFARLTAATRPHDWMNIMGGAIGWGLPGAVGAAVAAPDRKVIALEGDGSAMYTAQALWTMARESLDVAVVIFANRSYKILRGELANVGAGAPGQRAKDMLDLDRPFLDWIALARGMGVEAARVENLDDFAAAYRRATGTKGPYLIEVVM